MPGDGPGRVVSPDAARGGAAPLSPLSQAFGICHPELGNELPEPPLQLPPNLIHSIHILKCPKCQPHVILGPWRGHLWVLLDTEKGLPFPFSSVLA